MNPFWYLNMLLLQAPSTGFITDSWVRDIAMTVGAFFVIRYMNRVDKLLKEHSDDIVNLKIKQAVMNESLQKDQETYSNTLQNIYSKLGVDGNK